MRWTSKSSLASICLALLAVLAARPTVLAAQARPPELSFYRSVAEADDVEALWVNPGGLGIRGGSDFLSYVSVDAGGDLGEPAFRQALLGIRFAGLAAGYRRDWFDELVGFGRDVGHSWAIGAGFGTPAVSFGATRHWYRGGTRATAWELGGLARPAAWLSLGAAWRDTGSPVIAGVRQQEHIVLGVAVRPLGRVLTASGETELPTRGDDPVRHRAGVSVLTALGLEAFGVVDLNRDVAGSRSYALGLQFRFTGSNVDLLGRRTGAGRPNRFTVSRSSSPEVNEQPVFAPEPRIDRFDIGGSYVDYEAPGFALVSLDAHEAQPLLEALRQARVDPALRGLLVRVRPLSGAFIGPVTALHQELWSELYAFKAVGKPVVAYLDEGAGPAELYVASAAEQVVAPRLGNVALLGVNLELQRLRQTLARFHVGWDTLTAGEYKATFHTLFTDSATAMQAAWIDGLVQRAYDELVGGIATGRALTPDSVRALVDAGILTAHTAHAAGLIDGVGGIEEAERRARGLAGDLPFRSLRRLTFREERWGTPPTVVVIHARGPIVSGPSRRDPIWGTVTLGSETVVRQLREAANTAGVRSVVLRVDSPGGSAVASDEILHAVERVRHERQLPVIASMGNVAASGGYWISMRADSIVADPLTVTGSIGVVFAIPVVEELLDTLDVRSEQWTRGRFADLYTTTRFRSPTELSVLRGSMDHTYELFLQEVASGRNMPIDSARSLAGGRVWYGRDAHGVGLVDELGGLQEAIRIAAERGGIDEPYRVIVMRPPGPRLPFPLAGPLASLRSFRSLGSWLPRLILGSGGGCNPLRLCE